jgi:uncharacterized membrane protein YgcG
MTRPAKSALGLALVAALLLAVGLLFPIPAAGQEPRLHGLNARVDSLFPDAPTGRLVDPTGAVKDPAALEAALRGIWDRDSLPLYAVVLPTTGQRDEADVALEIGRKWLVAQAADSRSQNRHAGGVLLLVLDRHKCRVEVATGSEGYMTDADAAQACRDAAPAFRAGDYGGGLLAIAQEFDRRHAASKVPVVPPAPSRPIDVPWGWVLGLLALVAVPAALAWRRWRAWAARRRAEEARRLAEERRLQALRDAEAQRQREAAEARRQQAAAEAAERERVRWAGLTPDQQAAELAERAEQERLAALAAAEAAERRRREEAEEESRRSSYSSYDSSSSSSSDSSWGGGGSDSFGGGGGGSSW